MLKPNAKLVIINSEGITNLSIVIENLEHEIDVNTEELALALTQQGGFKVIQAELFTHPACCEHPEGCPKGDK